MTTEYTKIFSGKMKRDLGRLKESYDAVVRQSSQIASTNERLAEAALFALAVDNLSDVLVLLSGGNKNFLDELVTSAKRHVDISCQEEFDALTALIAKKYKASGPLQ